MKTILLEASAWREPGDFFDALLPELRAPAWHGRGLDALYDSLYGGINEVEPPFKVIVLNSSGLSPKMKAFTAQVAQVFADARKEFGHDVSFEMR
jgi:RNAse (barnase) inhibitor barstar